MRTLRYFFTDAEIFNEIHFDPTYCNSIQGIQYLIAKDLNIDEKDLIINDPPSDEQIRNRSKIQLRISVKSFQRDIDFYFNSNKKVQIKDAYKMNPKQLYESFQQEGHYFSSKLREHVLFTCNGQLIQMERPFPFLIIPTYVTISFNTDIVAVNTENIEFLFLETEKLKSVYNFFHKIFWDSNTLKIVDEYDNCLTNTDFFISGELFYLTLQYNITFISWDEKNFFPIQLDYLPTVLQTKDLLSKLFNSIGYDIPPENIAIVSERIRKIRDSKKLLNTVQDTRHKFYFKLIKPKNQKGTKGRKGKKSNKEQVEKVELEIERVEPVSKKELIESNGNDVSPEPSQQEEEVEIGFKLNSDYNSDSEEDYIQPPPSYEPTNAAAYNYDDYNDDDDDDDDTADDHQLKMPITFVYENRNFEEELQDMLIYATIGEIREVMILDNEDVECVYLICKSNDREFIIDDDVTLDEISDQIKTIDNGVVKYKIFVKFFYKRDNNNIGPNALRRKTCEIPLPQSVRNDDDDSNSFQNSGTNVSNPRRVNRPNDSFNEGDSNSFQNADSNENMTERVKWPAKYFNADNNNNNNNNNNGNDNVNPFQNGGTNEKAGRAILANDSSSDDDDDDGDADSNSFQNAGTNENMTGRARWQNNSFNDDDADDSNSFQNAVANGNKARRGKRPNNNFNNADSNSFQNGGTSANKTGRARWQNNNFNADDSNSFQNAAANGNKARRGKRPNNNFNAYNNKTNNNNENTFQNYGKRVKRQNNSFIDGDNSTGSLEISSIMKPGEVIFNPSLIIDDSESSSEENVEPKQVAQKQPTRSSKCMQRYQFEYNGKIKTIKLDKNTTFEDNVEIIKQELRINKSRQIDFVHVYKKDDDDDDDDDDENEQKIQEKSEKLKKFKSETLFKVIIDNQGNQDGKAIYFYQTNRSCTPEFIELDENATVKNMKEALMRKKNVKSLSCIKIIFAGKDLMNDSVLKALNIGDIRLFVYIRTDDDIFLKTAKALQYNQKNAPLPEIIEEEEEENETNE